VELKVLVTPVSSFQIETFRINFIYMWFNEVADTVWHCIVGW